MSPVQADTRDSQIRRVFPNLTVTQDDRAVSDMLRDCVVTRTRIRNIGIVFARGAAIIGKWTPDALVLVSWIGYKAGVERTGPQDQGQGEANSQNQRYS